MVDNLNNRQEYEVPVGGDDTFQITLAVANINPTDILVYTEDRTTPSYTVTILEQGVDYNVEKTVEPDNSIIWNVVTFDLLEPPLYLVIESALAYGQFSDYIEGDPMNPEVLEQDLDRLHILGIQDNANIEKAVRAPSDDPLPSQSFILPQQADRLGKYLYFDPVTGAVGAENIIGSGLRWSSIRLYDFQEIVEWGGVLYTCIVPTSTPGLEPDDTPSEWELYITRVSTTITADAVIPSSTDETTIFVDTSTAIINITLDNGELDNVRTIIIPVGQYPVNIISSGYNTLTSDAVCLVWNELTLSWVLYANTGSRAILDTSTDALIEGGAT